MSLNIPAPWVAYGSCLGKPCRITGHSFLFKLKPATSLQRAAWSCHWDCHREARGATNPWPFWSLLGGILPLWKMEWKSVGIIILNWMESHNPFMFQTTNQYTYIYILSITKIFPIIHHIPRNFHHSHNVGPPSYVCWFRFAPVTSSL